MRELPDLRPSTIGAHILVVAGVALTWILLFRANEILFSAFRHTDFASWIFLPAAVRMLSVMLFRWPAAIGLFIGALATADPSDDPADAVVIAALSGLAPMLAFLLCQKCLGMAPNLAGLRPLGLLRFAVAGAVANVLLLNGYLALINSADAHPLSIAVVFVGDLLGTLIVLYLAALILRFVRV